jgi:hypothetical protein
MSPQKDIDLLDDHSSIQSVPDWCCWSYRDRHLPETLHSVNGFTEARRLLHSRPTSDQGEILRALGLGLIARDICTAYSPQGEPNWRQAQFPTGYPRGVPIWVTYTPINFEELRTLLTPSLLQVPTVRLILPGQKRHRGTLAGPR